MAGCLALMVAIILLFWGSEQKDNCHHQENGWLKKREPFASKKRNAF